MKLSVYPVFTSFNREPLTGKGPIPTIVDNGIQRHSSQRINVDNPIQSAGWRKLAFCGNENTKYKNVKMLEVFAIRPVYHFCQHSLLVVFHPNHLASNKTWSTRHQIGHISLNAWPFWHHAVEVKTFQSGVATPTLKRFHVNAIGVWQKWNKTQCSLLRIFRP